MGFALCIIEKEFGLFKKNLISREIEKKGYANKHLIPVKKAAK